MEQGGTVAFDLCLASPFDTITLEVAAMKMEDDRYTTLVKTSAR